MLASACSSGAGGGGGGPGSGGAGPGGATGAAGRGAGGSSGGTGGTATGAGGSAAAGSGGGGGAAGRGSGGSGGGGGGATGAGGSGGLSAGCTPGQLAASGQLLSRFGQVKTTASSLEYYLQVNEWNTMSMQVMDYGGPFFFKMTTQMASSPTTGAPTGYPSMFIGANSRRTTNGSNLPRAVTALTTVPTTWTWNDNGTLADATTNSFNATYDVWFSTQAAGEPNASGPSGGFLMVWLHKPDDAQPIGRVIYPNVTIPGVDGTWNIWIGPNNNRPTVSYARTETTLSMSFDLNVFIKDALTRMDASGNPTIQSAWFLTNVFTGFEIWRGGTNLESTAFCTVVN